MVTYYEDEHLKALMDACSRRSTQPTFEAQRDQFVKLGVLLHESRYEVRVKIPPTLYPALESALDLAKCQAWGEDRLVFNAHHRRIVKLLDEDSVTRLARIA